MKHIVGMIVVLVLLAAAVVVPSVMAGPPTGAGPTDPMQVSGNWQTIDANSSVWFYFDYMSGDRDRAEADLDTNHLGNIRLSIYTPDQAAAWVTDRSTQPVGIGSQPGAQTAAAIHDLVWQGAFLTSGRYFVVVSNDNPTPVGIRLYVSGASVALAPTPMPTPYPTPLFNTPAPVVSVSGKFVFQEASGGNIYTVNGDGSSLTRLTVGLDPAWSPDGTQIAYSRWDDPAGLYVMNSDGSNPRLVFGWSKLLSPQWSPDGSLIAFSRQDGGNLDTVTRTFIRCFDIPFPPGVIPPFPHPQQCIGNTQTYDPNPWWKIGVVKAADGSLMEPKTTTHAFSPSWSTDNSTIAYADAGFGVQVTDLKQNASAPLYSKVADVQSVSWSPDGNRVAFEVRQHDHWEIAVMFADGSVEYQVTQPNPLAFGPVNNVAPTWSPDSKQILFLSDRNAKWEFFAVNPDGTGLQQVLKSVSDSIPIVYNFNNERTISWTK